MDQILATLLSWQFIIFGLAIAAFLFVIRKIVEYIAEVKNFSLKNSSFWNDLALPILPIILGALGAVLLKAFPYPDGLTTRGGRFVFGLVAGLLSSLLYRVVKAFLMQKLQSVAAVVSDVKTTDLPSRGSLTPDNTNVASVNDK